MADISSEQGTATTSFDSMSTMTMIILYPLDSDKGPMKSREMFCHGSSGTAWGFSGATVVPIRGFVD